jgi:hypothetical protein
MTVKDQPGTTTPNPELPAFLQTRVNSLLRGWNASTTWDRSEWEHHFADLSLPNRFEVARTLFPSGSMMERLSDREKTITEINTADFAEALLGLEDGESSRYFSSLHNRYVGSQKYGKYINTAFWREMKEAIDRTVHREQAAIENDTSKTKRADTWIAILNACKSVIG